MRPWQYGVLAAFLAFSAVGCSSDPREQLVQATITNMSSASGQLSSIADKLNQASKKAEKENPNGALTFTDLKDAMDAVKVLKDFGKELAKIKGQVDILPPLCAEDREDLAKRFQGKITDAIDDLQKNKKTLNQALTDAEKTSREAIREFREKLREAEGEYEALNRQS